MAIVLPASHTGPEAYTSAFPGKDVVVELWQDLIEDHNWLTAYRMRAHAGCGWPAGDIRAAIGASTTDIIFLCWPRIHADTLYFVAEVDTAGVAVAAAPLSVAIVDDATGVPIAGSPWTPAGIVAGTAGQIVSGTVGTIAGAGWYRITATITAGAGAGDSIDLRSFHFRDEDLDAADLAAI